MNTTGEVTMGTAIELRRDDPAITPMGILQMAVSQGADIDKLAKLLELQERWEANEARKAFNAAMAKFKQNPPHISKNKHVKFGNTEYDHATLANVTTAVTAALSAVGISHKWKVSQAEQIAVTCVLTHEAGHSEETTLRASADTSGSKNSIQAIGSAVTYLQRYTLLAAVGMATGGQDDDGKSTEEPAGVPEGIRLDWLEAIAACGDVPTLQRAFKESYKLAQDAQDKRFEAELIAAKDKQKEVIRARN